MHKQVFVKYNDFFYFYVIAQTGRNIKEISLKSHTATLKRKDKFNENYLVKYWMDTTWYFSVAEKEKRWIHNISKWQPTNQLIDK